MLVGGCAYGAVRYEVDGEISPTIHCHYQTFRDMGHIWRSDGASCFDPSVKLAEYPEAYPVSRRAPSVEIR